MEEDIFDGEALYEIIEFLPAGVVKMSMLLDAIEEADQEKDVYWQMYFRYLYACEVTFHDDPPKAIPMAAQFAQLFEEHPNVFPKGGEECYVMITQMGIDPMVNLPQISREQWEQTMAQYYELVNRFQLGLRTYWWQMARFWQYIDKQKAYEYFQKFWNTERDIISDCEACEQSHGVGMSLLVGDREGAKEYAKPMESGELSFCSDTPQMYFLSYLEDALNRGDLKEAQRFAKKLSGKKYMKKCIRDKSDLSYLSALIRCFSYTDLESAINKIPLGIQWSLKMWDRKKVYDFYKAAWVCFRELAKTKETVELDLDKEFPLYETAGSYSCSSLADWFYNQAQKIGQQFDKRNRSDYFAKDLALAGSLENGGV